VAIAAPPTEGQANEELIEYIASVLGTKKRQVSLDRGGKSRSKVLIVSDLEAEDVYKKLKAVCEEDEREDQ